MPHTPHTIAHTITPTFIHISAPVGSRQALRAFLHRYQAQMKMSGIKAMRAKAEYAQLCARDPTELNRALITAEAAVRKLGGTGKACSPAVLWWMQR